MNKYYYKGKDDPEISLNGIILRINREQACSALEEAGIKATSLTLIPEGQHVYLYTGFNSDGHKDKGEIITESSGNVNKILKGRGVFPVSINQVQEFKKVGAKVNTKVEEPVTKEDIKPFTISFKIFGFRFSFTIERV